MNRNQNKSHRTKLEIQVRLQLGDLRPEKRLLVRAVIALAIPVLAKLLAMYLGVG